MQKNGALVDVVFAAAHLDVAGDGSRVTYLSIQCFAGAASCTGQRDGEGEPYASTRTNSGWATVALAPPAQLGSNTAELLGADPGTALFSIASPPGGQDDWFARKPDGSLHGVGPVTPPALGPRGPIHGGTGVMGTADLSHIVWAQDGLQSTVLWPFDLTTGLEGAGSGLQSVYEYSGLGNSQPVMVGVSGGRGSTDLISKCGTYLGGQTAATNTPGALSADGSTVFFTAQKCESGSGVNSSTPVPAFTVYARIDGARTVLISGRSPADCTTPGCQGSQARNAVFVDASENGSKAFFLSPQQLTDSASEDPVAGDEGVHCPNAIGANGCNLYLYDFANPAGHELVDISAGDTSGGGPRVQGVMAVSPDGSHVYFVAQGVLTSAPNGEGQTAQSGANNLYVYERDAAHPSGETTFIATLLPSDGLEWKIFEESGFKANVTPDGRFLVFTSHGRLTADVANANGAAQVFRYDAQTGQLLRLSLGDVGFNANGNGGRGDATIVRALNFTSRLGPMRTDPTMSDDGSYVFFQSPIALTPNALNDVATDSEGDLAQNVYEWHEGRVSLISDGHDRSGDSTHSCLNRFGVTSVCLLGSDRSGANVFFTTSDSLVTQDGDTELDIYDAHVGGGFPEVPPASACQGEACQGVVGAQPGSVAAATVAFSGTGNLVPPGPVAVAHRKPVVRRHVKRRTRRRRSGRGRAHRAKRMVAENGGRR